MIHDDRNRLHPTFDMLGDDSAPCRWWHLDMAASCARCGSTRQDLHDGWWTNDHPVPWTTVERLRLGLPVEGEW